MSLPLRFLISESTTLAGVVVTLSLASLYVNLAQAEIAIRLPEAERETVAISSLSSGENRYWLPVDCDEIINLSYLTQTSASTGFSPTGPGFGIKQASVWELDSNSRGTQTGVPVMYVPFAQWIELYPSPDSSYSVQLRYLRRFSDLTNLEATPSLATRFHPAVMMKAAELLAQRAGDFQRSAMLGNRFVSYMGSVPDALASRQRNRGGLGMRLIKQAD